MFTVIIEGRVYKYKFHHYTSYFMISVINYTFYAIILAIKHSYGRVIKISFTIIS
jgi:hypothetical protein